MSQSSPVTARELAEELREYTAMKYAGDCKCGKCQLVPRELVERIYHTLNGTFGLAQTPGLEKFCIAFTWAYGTAIELKHYGKVHDDGMTPETLWAEAAEEDRDFMRSVIRDTFAALDQGPDTSTDRACK